ncbi:hypothetical protein HYI36_18630 [Bacillus sp. Gen3]|uniref:hypothetical protein n=1 Tax=Heyndrickxia oleronia TaxID=38875 RepID=UPI0015D1A58F|nr:hypothetical protein [Bacillus sp. Gen3]
MIYTLCKKVIESGKQDYNSMLTKLDVYLLGERITPDQYTELKGLMDAQQEEVK